MAKRWSSIGDVGVLWSGLLVLLACQCSLGLQEGRAEDAHQGSESVHLTSSSSSSTARPGYRVSRPETRQPDQRVPPHLQDIRKGYVDDDAGEVIRIIEPPQHFQQLKRQRQQQQGARPPTAVIWEQPRKLSINQAAPRPPSADLLTQETRLNAHTPAQLNKLQLPLEILASVRKTERLLHRQRPAQRPLMRQRHISRQTHTLISQKALEQQRYQRGQEQRLRAALTQEHKRSKRVKRELPPPPGQYDVEEGLKLVAHIGELLRNATFYLPDELELNVSSQAGVEAAAAAGLAQRTKSEVQQCANATKCNDKEDGAGARRLRQQLQRRRQQLFKLAHGTHAAKSPKSPKSAITTTTTPHFRHEATTTTTTTTTSSTTSATPQSWRAGKTLSSRLVNASKSPNRSSSSSSANHLPQRRSDQRAGGAAVSRKLRSDESAALTRASAELLYDDVMTNIRNLWQEHDEAAASPPQFVAPADVANNTDFRALHVYLKELDEIAKLLPTVASITAPHSNGSNGSTLEELTTAKLSLNTEELEWATPTPSWYLINKEGKIYETRLDSETKPAAGLFHRFPDMPKSPDVSLDEETLLDVE